MKKILTTIVLLSSVFGAAQDNANEVEKHQLKLNLLLTPNIDFELGLSKHATLVFQLGTELGGVEDLVTDDFYVGLFPMAKMSFRQYHNFERRANKGKNTSNNSANYYSLSTTYILGNPIIIENDIEVVDDYFLQLGVVYGLQRRFAKRFNFTTELGIGYGYSNVIGGGVVPILNFNLGWIIL